MSGSGSIMDYLAHGPAEVAEGQVAAFKPGEPAEHAEGYKYMGPWETFADGFSEHSRRSARALFATGVPVHLRSLNQDNLKSDTPEMQPIEQLLRPMLRASIRQYVAEIYQIVPHDSLLQFLTTHQHYGESEMRVLNAHRVLYTVWERDRITAAARVALNRVGQAWVAAQATAEMLVANGVDPRKVRVVPCPFFPDDPHLALAGRKRRKGVPRFYHIGKWEPRKAQTQIIGTFLRAFRPGEAELYLKVSPFAANVELENYPKTPAISVHEWLRDERVRQMGWSLADLNRCIFLIQKRMPTEDLVRLHAAGDVYVSMSRGEGFDMPAQDAKLAGNLMLYTPSGGTQAFAGPLDVRIEATGRVPCHPFYKWNEDAGYIDYDLDEAVVKMRYAATLVSQPQTSSQVGMTWCSAAVVGAAMRANMEELRADGRKVAIAVGEELLAREAQSAPAPPLESIEQGRIVEAGPRIFFATHGAAVDAPYGGARVNALLAELLYRHPLIGAVENVGHDMIPEKPTDIAMVEVPTGAPYVRRLNAKKVVLLRYGDQGHGACAYELFERGVDAVVLVPSEYAYRTLSYRIPYRVVWNAFEPPDMVREGGSLGKKVLYTGAYRFAKDTPLAARVATEAPDLQFVWRRSTDIGEPLAPIATPPNVELLDPTADRDELWRDIGCVLVTSRYESFCLIAYEAACRGIPVVFHEELASIREWAGTVDVASDTLIHGAQSAGDGLRACRTPVEFAKACRAAIGQVGDGDRFLPWQRVADRTHARSLAQLDAFVREYLTEGFL